MNKKLILASSLSLLGISAVDYNYTKPNHNTKLNSEITACSKLIKRYKEEHGIPGIVVAISRDGKTLYNRGFGYSDVENSVKARADTVMRIASISKPITCTLAAMLLENNQLDIDKPIETYLKDLPNFKFNDQEVKITSRQLMCHSSGIRHYAEEVKDSDDPPEFLSNKPYKETKDALKIFINDKLSFIPGQGHLYTTYGYTLLSAVLEKCNGDKPFSEMITNFFKSLDMNETFLDRNGPLISNRSKYYKRNKKSCLVNVPEVDSSYKYAGGGILSTTGDLLKFGNHMLNIYHSFDNVEFYCLKSKTLKSLLWAPQSKLTKKKQSESSLDISKSTISYGLGWVVSYKKNTGKLEHVHHTGGAVGASSCLLIVPIEESNKNGGLVVSVLCNSQSVGDIAKFTQKVASVFLSDEE